MDGYVEGRRFYRITAENQGAKVLVCAYILTTQTLLSIIARASVKLASARAWAWDDTAITASAVFAIGHTICMVVAYSNGLGVRAGYVVAEPAHYIRLEEANYAANIIYFASITLAKSSMIIFAMRLTPSLKARRLCLLFLLCIGLWGSSSIISSALSCGFPKPWIYKPTSCINLAVFIRTTTVIDIMTDYMLVALTIWLFVWNSNMHFTDRMTIFAVFSIRAITLIPNVLRLRAAHVAYEESTLDNITWNLVPVEVWTIVGLHLSVITASVPCVRPFLRSLESGLLDSSLRLHPRLERGHSDEEKNFALTTIGGWRIGLDKQKDTISTSSTQKDPLHQARGSSESIERARESSVASDVAFSQQLHPEQSGFRASIQASRTFPQFPRTSNCVNKGDERRWENIAITKETQIRYEQGGRVLQELRTQETFVGSSM